MNVNAQAAIKAEDWMIGGSRDVAGERVYGFGPQDAAQAASIAYNLAVQMFESVPREEFVGRLTRLFFEEMHDVLEAKAEFAGH